MSGDCKAAAKLQTVSYSQPNAEKPGGEQVGQTRPDFPLSEFVDAEHTEK